MLVLEIKKKILKGSDYNGGTQWSSHPPQDQKTRVRFQPGYSFWRKHSKAVVYN
jgi:hypothetical protein